MSNPTQHPAPQPIPASTCDACGKNPILDVETGACAACIDAEIAKSGDPAPGCYCSLSIKCDYCTGLRVWGVSELGTPAAVKAAAARIGTTAKALARYSTRHLREAGFVVAGRRVEVSS